MLIIGGIFVDAIGSLHLANDFNINIDGMDVTLQDAIDGGLLIGEHTYAVPSSIAVHGHSVGDIWISTESGEMTLLNALTTGTKIYGDNVSIYSGVASNTGHFANDIMLSSGKSLQEIINEGSICTLETCESLGATTGTFSDGCNGELKCDPVIITAGTPIKFSQDRTSHNSLVKIDDTSYLNTYRGHSYPSDGHAVVLRLNNIYFIFVPQILTTYKKDYYFYYLWKN